MVKEMSDHSDSEHFSYHRKWKDIEDMLEKAESVMNHHYSEFVNTNNNHKKKKMHHARNYKALQGVVKTLRWCLGDKDIEHPLD
jgi:hypothetical protein